MAEDLPVAASPSAVIEPGQRYDQGTAAPSNKVVTGTLAAVIGGTAAGGIVIQFAWTVFAPSRFPPMPIEVGYGLAAVAATVAGAIGGLAAYFRRDRAPR